ncbi:MAG: hypothetical protein ACRD5G_08280, partial [Candidatus Acidiferrales bacterium]
MLPFSPREACLARFSALAAEHAKQASRAKNGGKPPHSIPVPAPRATSPTVASDLTLSDICGGMSECSRLTNSLENDGAACAPADPPGGTMLIVMQAHASEEQFRQVCARIETFGLKAHPIPCSIRTAIGITGKKGAVELGVLEQMPGVAECIP